MHLLHLLHGAVCGRCILAEYWRKSFTSVGEDKSSNRPSPRRVTVAVGPQPLRASSRPPSPPLTTIHVNLLCDVHLPLSDRLIHHLSIHFHQDNNLAQTALQTPISFAGNKSSLDLSRPSSPGLKVYLKQAAAPHLLIQEICPPLPH